MLSGLLLASAFAVSGGCAAAGVGSSKTLLHCFDTGAGTVCEPDDDGLMDDEDADGDGAPDSVDCGSSAATDASTA